MSTFAIINHRTGTAAEWTAANPVLEKGELGYESDTYQMKLGDGTKTWAQLSYAGGGSLTPSQQRTAIEVFNNQTSATSGNDRVPFSGKIYIADPAVVGTTGANIDGAAAGDLWFW
jgi:hypothetical protein